MSATKDTPEVAKKPSSEAKRIIQNDQEKQRKEKIKTCIGEIAKELPPSADHVDRKMSTLSIVSQAKDYIKVLKEKTQAFEKNFAVAEQEELKKLRGELAEKQEKIKHLEEKLKAHALEKVLKSKSTEDSNSSPGPDGRHGRPKTIKLLEKERNEQIQMANTDYGHMDPPLPMVGSFSHQNNGTGGNTNNSLPSSSIVLPAASSGISIMTVAPTILSVKSPSLGQTRNQQTSRSISTSSVAGSTTSSRVNPTSSTLGPFLDVINNDFVGTGNARVDSGQVNMVYTTSALPLTTSVMSSASGNIIGTTDLMGMQQNSGNAVCGNGSGGTGDFSLLHHQQQGISPLLGLHQDGGCSASALQTLASVATSSHMAGGLSMASNQSVGSTAGMMGLPAGLTSMSVGHLHHQQQGQLMTDTNSTQGCKQVYINGQVMTLSDQGLTCGQQQHGDTDCQTSIQTNSFCQQSVLPLGAGPSFQQQHTNLSSGGLLNHGNFGHAGSLNPGSVSTSGSNQSVIYTINDQGQLVPLHSSIGQIQTAGPGLDFVSVSTAGGNIISGFQNSSAGALISSSMQHAGNFLTQPPMVSLAGGQAGAQPFTLLSQAHSSHLSNQIIQTPPMFMSQPVPQQNQVLNLGGLSGLQMVNPFNNMLVNNMTTTLNGATVKLVGNELKIIQPGESSAAQGPTHVMVDGSLIPISTNPQTIMPASVGPLNTIAQKQQQLSLGGNSILQFDPNNPNAPPILISGPVTTFQMMPQIIGAGALHSSAPLSAQHSILQMGGSSAPFQLASTGGSMAVASSMVSNTVTTNSVTACISSPSVSASAKVGSKGLPPLAPALSQTSPTMGSTMGITTGYQTVMSSSVSQQFIINGQKIVTSKLNTTLPNCPPPKSVQNRKRSPSASRGSPIAATDVGQQFTQPSHLTTSTASALVMPIQPTKNISANNKQCKSKSAKALAQQSQHHEDKAATQLVKTDLLAQATATAGILMDAEAGSGDYNGANESTLNISASSNISGSSTELQINLKQSPRDEEDDNVQLIIDENCMSGISSASPAHSSFSPNMSLGQGLSVNTSTSLFTHDLALGGPQMVHLQPSSGELTTPLVSPSITTPSMTSKQHKQMTSSPVTGVPNQKLNPVSSAGDVLSSSSASDVQIMAGPFRPEDVYARLAADSKVKLSPDTKQSSFSISGSGITGVNTTFDSMSGLSANTCTSAAVKNYIPIAPAPSKAPPNYGSDQSMTFIEAMSQAGLVPDKPGSKSKSRSRKTSTPVLSAQAMTFDSCDVQPGESKKKAPSKKRKTKAELLQEKEDKERVAREEEAERKRIELIERGCSLETKHGMEELIPVLNENEAVKEQILHSVSESKLINSDGSQISLMDMVAKIEIFNPGGSDVDDEFPLGHQTLGAEPVACSTPGKDDPDKTDSKSAKRESARKRKTESQNIAMVAPGQKVDNKKTKKPTKVDTAKSVSSNDIMLCGLGNNVSSSITPSDIYAFVDEEDTNMTISFLQQPMTPLAAKSPTKKNSSRKSKNSKDSVPEASLIPPVSAANILMPRSESKNNTCKSTRQTSGVKPLPVAATSVVSTSSPSSFMMHNSSFSSLPNKPQLMASQPIPATSSPVFSTPKQPATTMAAMNSFMPKKVAQASDNAVSLEETFSMEFPVMDFHSSPKLSQDDHDNSIGLPAETIADFFSQQGPASPPTLPNGVLSPSDVDLPALRTPATPMNHSHSDPVLMLETQSSKPPTPPNKQPQSRMHTPPPLDPKSPANSMATNMSIPSSNPGPSLSLAQSTSSSPMPQTLTSVSTSQSSCMNSGGGLHHQMEPVTARAESPMPSLSSSSLDALSEIIPLKPITSELEPIESCSQQQRRPTPVLTQPLTHVPLGSDIGMGLPDLQQKSQRPNPPHLPAQSSPHNLRPPSASNTPLPSPKLHASPGSASSVHSMSPAAHSCQKQQSSQMGNTGHMERGVAPPLSHPPPQASSLSQLYPDTSPCSANFASPPSGTSMKLKHMSPSNAQETQNFISSQKAFPQNSGQQSQKNQYSVDKIIEHPNSAASSRLAESFNFTNIGSNVTTASAILPTGSMPLPSPSSSGFSFSLSPTSSQPSSCSGNLSAPNNSNTSNRGSLSSMQNSIPPSGSHASHNTSYLSPFYPPAPMNIPSSSASAAHHSLAMHPLGNMEIQHTTRPSSGNSAATPYELGPSSLMTYGNQPKLDIPPIVKSPTYNTGTTSTSSTGTSNNGNKSSNNVGSGASNYGSASKQSMDTSSNNRYPGSKSTPESIYQQQQKRPNTIQHPPASHMDPMSHLSASAHNNSFFPMGFSSAASASMPLRHLPDTRDIPSRSPYDYPSVTHHPAMGFAHPHSQITSGYGAHSTFARDCARLETSHHQQQTQQQQTQQQQSQQQQQQQPQQPQQQQSQQSPRKQSSAPKKSSSGSSVGGTNNSSGSSSGTSNNSSSNRNTTNNTASSSISQGHSPASSTSSRTQSSQHHSNHQQNNTSSSNNASSSSHNRSSGNSQKRKSASSSSSSSKKKNTASQHSFPADPMDASMSQNMFESTFNYLNFPTLAQSMSPPAARPHQSDTPFLGGMFNTPARPISNSSTKTADMAASHFPLFHPRAQNSFFQTGGFGMNSMTGNHSNAAAGISPHSMGVPPHMSFGLFGNDATGSTDSNKFLHSNPILPGAPHQTMDHSLQHGAHQSSLYHSRPHSAQSHVMAAFYPHGFDSRGHMGQPFNSSMGPPTFHTPGLPPINFSMHDSH